MPKKPRVRAWRLTHKFCSFFDSEDCERWRALIAGRVVWLRGDDGEWGRAKFSTTEAVKEYTGHADVYISVTAREAKRLDTERRKGK